MRSAVFFLALLTAPAFAQQLEAPPWGWTDVSASLPGFSTHRTAVGDETASRELHFWLDTGETTTERAVFVTVFERPSRFHRLWRAIRFGDVPYTANVDMLTFETADPRSLGLAEGLVRDAEAAYTFVNDERDEVGLAVRTCRGDLCYEAMAHGPDDGSDAAAGHYASLLQSLTVRC